MPSVLLTHSSGLARYTVLDLSAMTYDAVAQALFARAPDGPRLMVRVSALDSGRIDADLDAVVAHRPDAIMLPEAMGGEDAQHLSVKLAVREAEAGLADGTVAILPVVERAGALLRLGGYAGATRRLMGLAWSAEGLAADLGAALSRLPDGGFSPPFELARSLTLFAARAAGVCAIDTAFADAGDLDGLRAECARARRDGFAGKIALDEAQAGVVEAAWAGDERMASSE